MRKFKWKKNEWGESLTKCPYGFKTFTSGRPKRVGDDCRVCKYKKCIDYENHVVECAYVKKNKV